MPSLRGKKALVTGASGGIGRAIALRLAQLGAAVAVRYGLSAARADAVVDAIKADGGHAFAGHADLNYISTIIAMFETLAAQGFGTLDILINNSTARLNASLTGLIRRSAVDGFRRKKFLT